MRAQWAKFRRRAIVIAAISLAAVAIAGYCLPACVCGPRETRLQVIGGAPDGNVSTPRSLTVMTLNIAHGRKDGRHQILQKRAAFRSHMDDIAAVLVREKPDVVALQEADGPSFWSGNFNHVQCLAEKAKFPYSMRGEHVKGLKLSYGTALLSELELKDAVSVAFKPSPLTPPKGFVAGTIEWPGSAGIKADVVSVHLDFARKSVRKKQVQELVEKLSERKNAVIVMGDFNCEWTGREPTLRTLANKLKLRTYEPKSAEMKTFPKLKIRIDWILVSPEIEFETCEVIPDVVSDHLGVIARLKINKKPE